MILRAACLLCALVLVGALGTDAAPGGENNFAVRVAKHKDGPYKVDIKSNIAPEQTRSFWFRVHNGDNEQFQLTFDDAETSDEKSFKTRWFKAGNNVSSEVEGKGYEFKVDPGQNKYFNAKQTGLPAPGAVEGCLAGQASIPMVTSDLSSVSINQATCSF